MNLIWELLAALVVLGMGWLLCSSGYEAWKTQNTLLKGKKITGKWAQFVGVLFLIIGLPLLLLGVSVFILMLGSIFK
ncbi:MAG: hypothetical protein AAB336_05315 [Acidobacteriota bacterium]